MLKSIKIRTQLVLLVCIQDEDGLSARCRVAQPRDYTKWKGNLGGGLMACTTNRPKCIFLPRPGPHMLAAELALRAGRRVHLELQ
jgi:hypothetical protein